MSYAQVDWVERKMIRAEKKVTELTALVRELADALEIEQSTRGVPVHPSVDVSIDRLLARARAALGDKP